MTIESHNAPALAEESLWRLGWEAGLVPVLHTADDGETKLSSLVELCGRHHRLLH